MHIKSFQIQSVRSINDSSNIDASRITALLGRNESGKSNLLRGLHTLNPPECFVTLRDGAGERIVAMGSKGDELAGNLDTEYKRELLDTLSKAFGAPHRARCRCHEAQSSLKRRWSCSANGGRSCQC